MVRALVMRPVPLWILAVASGSLVAAASIAVVLSNVPVADLQLSTFDALFASERGPRLGRHPVLPGLAIVEFDAATAHRRITTVEDDLRLYRVLLDAGAKAVADLRLIAGDSPETRKLLDGMVALNAPGRVSREAWVEAPWVNEHRDQYAPYLSHDGFNLHGVLDATHRQRFVPLLVAAGRGLEETTPLRVARLAMGFGTAAPAELARDSGILAAWQRWLPEGTQLRGPLAAGSSVHLPYPFGDRALPWMERPTGIDTVPPAQLWVDFGAAPKAVPHYSYIDALEGRVPREALAGAVVFIGSTSEFDAGDSYFVPAYPSWRVSAADLAASAFETIVAQRFMRPLSTAVAVAMLAVLALVAALVATRFNIATTAIVFVGMFIAYFAGAMVLARCGWFPDLFLAPLTLLVSGSAVAGIRFRREESLRSRVINLFGRYVAKRVVEDILKRPDSEVLAVGGVNREITVLFADVRGFTTYSDQLPPERVLGELNSLLGLMVACAFEHEGTVDKYIGDAILVLFNAPQHQADHVLRAVRTAWAMQRALEGHPSGLAFGIGIHTGEAVVGTIGTPERMEYTAIGATVNLASRLCGTADRGQVAVSDAVQQALEGREFTTEARPPMRVKGIDRELMTFLVTGRR